MADDLLTFELSPDGDTLDIHGDSSGLRRLAAILERLASGTKADHEHLATREWAGDELSSESQGGRILDKVTIHSWVEE